MVLLLFFAIFAFLLIFILFRRVDRLQKELDSLRQYTLDLLPAEAKDHNDKATASPAEEKSEHISLPVKSKTEEISVSFKDKHGKIYQDKVSDGLFDRLTLWVKNYFTQGNIVVRIGGALLFFGVAFLLKYAAQHSTISMEVRLIGVAVSAIVLLGIGWRLRLREGSYGLILQGIGIAMLYLVILVAAKYYGLFSLGLAFGLMFALVTFASLLAVIQNALPLALFSLVGGFMAPILTSDGSGSHIVLFTYYALLDIGIVVIAWYQSWRSLNLLGFFFTFVIATAWGVLRYDPALLHTTEPFLVLFFLLYLLISILFTLKQPFHPRGFIDATLIFGLPLVAFSLQISLVYELVYGAAYSALVIGILYLLLSKILFFYEKMRLLGEAFLALGVVFCTIAIPYAFDDQFTSALWVLESTAIIWIALRQHRRYARYFGEFLQMIGILLYAVSSELFSREVGTAFLNPNFLGYFIITLATLLSAYLLYRDRVALSRWDRQIPMLFAILAISIWLISGVQETENLPFEQGNLMLIYIAFAALLLMVLARHLQWGDLVSLLQFYLPLGIVFILNMPFHLLAVHPFGGIGFLALVLFFAMNYWLLYRFDEKWSWQAILHLVGLWLIVLLGIREVQYVLFLLTENRTWQDAGIAVLPLVVSILILHWKYFLPTVFGKYRSLYRFYGVGAIMLGLLIWQFKSFALAGDPAPLTYILLINPLDLMQLMGVAILFDWLHLCRDRFDDQKRQLLLTAAALLALLLISIVYARSIHFYREIPYTFGSLFESLFFQTGLSILWTFIAMILMVIAKQYHHRMIWIGGFGLLSLVVAKLFFVELSGSGTVERIISFIVVGSLLLLIGYLAPIPPKTEGEMEAKD